MALRALRRRLLLTGIPLLDALLEQWGQENRPIARACRSFFLDLEQRYEALRAERWRTPNFRRWDPEVRGQLQRLRQHLERLEDRQKILESGRALREALGHLEREEAEFPKFSPHFQVQRLAYLAEGWQRDFLSPEPLKQFLASYLQDLKKAEEHLSEAARSPGESPEAERVSERLVDETHRFGRRLKGLQRAIQGSDRRGVGLLMSEVTAQAEKLHLLQQELESILSPRRRCPFCAEPIDGTRCGGCGRPTPLPPGATETFSTSDRSGPTRSAYVVRLEESAELYSQGQIESEEFLATCAWFQAQVQGGLRQLKEIKSPDLGSGPAPMEEQRRDLKSGGEAMLAGVKSLQELASQGATGALETALDRIREGERRVLEAQAELARAMR